MAIDSLSSLHRHKAQSISLTPMQVLAQDTRPRIYTWPTEEIQCTWPDYLIANLKDKLLVIAESLRNRHVNLTGVSRWRHSADTLAYAFAEFTRTQLI